MPEFLLKGLAQADFIFQAFTGSAFTVQQPPGLPAKFVASRRCGDANDVDEDKESDGERKLGVVLRDVVLQDVDERCRENAGDRNLEADGIGQQQIGRRYDDQIGQHDVKQGRRWGSVHNIFTQLERHQQGGDNSENQDRAIQNGSV